MKTIFLCLFSFFILGGFTFATCTISYETEQSVEKKAVIVGEKLKSILSEKPASIMTIVIRKLLQLAENKPDCEKRLMYFFIARTINSTYVQEKGITLDIVKGDIDSPEDLTNTQEEDGKNEIIRKYYLGPRGGCYYENLTGKIYVDKSFCNQK